VTERPMFVPTADGVRDVLDRARTRRRRRIALTAAGATAALTVGAVVAIAPGAGAGADRLHVEPASPAPTAPPTAPPSPQQTTSSAPTPSHPPISTSTAVGPGSAVVRPFAPQPPADSPTPTAPAHRHSAPAPITRTTVGYDAAACDATNDVVGWCIVYTGPDSGRRKHPVHLSMELCRPQVNGDGSIHFDDTREIDLELFAPDGSVQWRAGQGVRYASPGRTVVVRAGTCLRWVSTWDTIAPDGFYAPPGDYSISYALDSSDVGTSYGGITLHLTD